ncbi:hypothetical protein QTG56_22370 (plasmid) [Rossellomorea sp. AcN35-11]|nr:hypothetical protein [Rossellomorea aquimaris]WJV32120.1 hypothetical protein QTG56_22370 [Rossellomorea sp. AcN35-11]
MRFKKSDWTLVREAEASGLMVAMTSILEPKRTPHNEILSKYFKDKMFGFSGSFSEFECEDVLDGINEYLREYHPGKNLLNFPGSSGSEIYLVPITEHLNLKVLIVDEYYGDGCYEKYVMTNYFMIDESASESDVDVLIKVIKEYLVT